VREKKVWSTTIEQRSKWTALVEELPEIVAKDLLLSYLVTQEPAVLATLKEALETGVRTNTIPLRVDLEINEFSVMLGVRRLKRWEGGIELAQTNVEKRHI